MVDRCLGLSGFSFLKILHRHHDGHMSKMAANLALRGSCGAWTQPLPLSHTDFKKQCLFNETTFRTGRILCGIKRKTRPSCLHLVFGRKDGGDINDALKQKKPMSDVTFIPFMINTV